MQLISKILLGYEDMENINIYYWPVLLGSILSAVLTDISPPIFSFQYICKHKFFLPNIFIDYITLNLFTSFKTQ